jgi:molybdate transport system substrate-binding protein
MTRLLHQAPGTPARWRLFGVAALVGVAVVAAACGGDSGSSSPGTSGGTGTTASSAKVSGSITVSAAASLTGAFGQLGEQFQSAHPGTTIAFNFGSSGTLATQIQQGAPADVFASADTQDMNEVQTSGDIDGKPSIFARNSLEIVTKPGNPLGIHSLADLNKASVVSLCVTTAPCGSTARQALSKADVTIPASKITLGPDVKSTLQQVTTGDADAGIVYVTDAMTVGSSGEAVPIKPSQNVVTSYPIAVVKSTGNASLATAWIQYVLSPTGQKVLRQAGFLPAG